MKALIVFVAAVFTCVPLFAQNQLAPVPAACGDLQLSMSVDLDATPHSMIQPEPGKARIYFIQDTGLLGNIRFPTVKIGIDGKWVGANKRQSYFSVPVAPGEHHICAAVQAGYLKGTPVTLAHYTAEPGKMYFYRTKLTYSETVLEYLDLEPIDSDQAKFLIESYRLATALAKK